MLGIRKKIAECSNTFSAERQEAEAAVKAKVADLKARLQPT